MTTIADGPQHRDGIALPDLARGPVLAAMAALAVTLTATSGGYGYHRDELYFRMLPPRWGYFDEPPLAPLLAHGLSMALDSPWVMRLPAALAAVASVYVVVLITREVGGGRGAQTLCAWAYAFAALPLVMGHVLLTSTLDLPVWPLVLLFVIRAQLRAEPRWWLAAGVVVGISTYNKLLVVILLVAVTLGFAVVGPRRVLWSRPVLAAAGVALLIGAPNLAYQAAHHWPQLTMGRALREHNGSDVRVTMWPLLILMLGPPLVPIWGAGLAALSRRPEWRPIRFLVPALPVLLLIVFLMGAQSYYPFGLLAVIFAVGCVPTLDWVGRAPSRRRPLIVIVVAVNAAVSAVIGLPLLPVTVVGDTPVPGINQAARDTVGWPVYVRQIGTVWARLPAADRARAVVVASNYGEAGAVDRYGAPHHLPAVYSGQNELYFLGRPPDSADVAVVVGGQVPLARTLFRSCRTAAKLDNGVGVDNEEQGQPVAVCRHPIGGWPAVWPKLRHAD